MISIGVSTRCGGAGDEPLPEILEREGYPTYRGKTNLGLGELQPRMTNHMPKVPDARRAKKSRIEGRG